MEELLRTYQDNHDRYKLEQDKVNLQLRGLSWLRLSLFLGVIAVLYFVWPYDVGLAVGAAIVLFACFLFIVRKYVSKEQQRNIIRNLISINQEEMVAVCGDYSIFPNGENHIDSEHDYSFDLDVFGAGGLFQMINRTATVFGSAQLGAMLKKPLMEGEAIISRQKAVEELAQKMEWRQRLQAIARLDSENEKDKESLEQWQNDGDTDEFSEYWNRLVWGIPVLTVGALVVAIAGVGSWLPFNVLAVFQLAILGVFRKRITAIHLSFGKKKLFLKKYILLLKHIQLENFESELLNDLQQKLKNNGSATKEIQELEKLIGALDTGMSLMGILLLNSTLLWNLRHSIRLLSWYKRCQQNLSEWFQVIGELEALSALGNFAKNHPGFTFPEPKEEGRGIVGEEMGHPFLGEERCVVNNFAVEKAGDVHIITGANMAGKSTFLRTVGVNLILAMAGAPVFAEKMQFVPIRLFTHMRTTDSLVNDESYFYAELKRLRLLLDKMLAGERVFVILDEILRGTNSVDKLNGSREFVRRLLETNTPGIVATHDLKLAQMETEFPDNIFNHCFEVTLAEGKLDYSYQLKPGVTQTMNATYLMEQMGIIPKKEELLAEA
ncbi:hypothetical protein EMN47_15540 [Prolixibacteraceae bacterium JC049]|nr:hypothetical protein [Prolixibacteraceae bacterium JC049]